MRRVYCDRCCSIIKWPPIHITHLHGGVVQFTGELSPRPPWIESKIVNQLTKVLVQFLMPRNHAGVIELTLYKTSLAVSYPNLIRRAHGLSTVVLYKKKVLFIDWKRIVSPTASFTELISKVVWFPGYPKTEKLTLILRLKINLNGFLILRAT